jgi:DNA-directed RNA polymerase II subunit RPB1
MRLVNRVQPKYRMKHVWARAHSILDCHEDEADVNEEGDVVAISGHGGCGHRQPVIRKEGLRLIMVYKQTGQETEDGGGKKGKSEGPNMPDKRDLTAEDAHAILAKIVPLDLELLGLSAEYARPDWMILTVLPVPPPPVRPFVTTPGQPTAQDDLTYKLSDILKTNATVAQLNLEGAAGHIANDFWQLLQVSIMLR